MVLQCIKEAGLLNGNGNREVVVFQAHLMLESFSVYFTVVFEEVLNKL